MELLARHTIDNRGTDPHPSEGEPSRTAPACASSSAGWRSPWASAPSRPTSKPAAQACPIRYQCAGCPHFESDPSYLPELRAYADQLRREREAMIAVGAAEWAVANVAGQLEVIIGHIRHHENLLKRLPADERALIDDASTTLRKARQAVPVAFGRRAGPLMTDNSHALRRSRRQDSQTKRRTGRRRPPGHDRRRRAGQLPGRRPPSRSVGVAALRRQGTGSAASPTPETANATPGQTRAWRLPTRSLISRAEPAS